MDLAGRTVLVTGAGGFIGRTVVQALLQREVHVRGLLGPEDMTIAGGSNIQLLRADIRDIDSLRHAVRGADSVIHLAGPASVAESFKLPHEYAAVHVGGTASILSQCDDAGVGRFVYISSAEVYGQPRSNPVREDHAYRARSPYGAAKIGAEQFVSAFADAVGMEAVILRPFSVYGPGVSTSSVIGTILRQTELESTVRVQNLAPIRDYCFVADVADAIVRACCVAVPERAVINLGSGVGTSVREIIELIMELREISMPVVQARLRDRPRHTDIDCLVADVTCARKILGWTSETTLAQGLKQMIGATACVVH